MNTNPWDSFTDVTGKKNRSWFEGQPVDINGLAVSSGQVRSKSNTSDAAVWINASGNVFLDPGPIEMSAVVEGMSGFGKIIKGGLAGRDFLTISV